LPKPRPKKRTTKPGRRTPAKPLIKRDLILPVLAAVALVAAAAVFMLSSPQKRRPQRPPAPHKAVEKATAPPEQPKPEYPPEPEPAEPVAMPYTTVAAPGGKAKVAIVIDDMGSDLAHIDALLALDVPLSIAVLPYQPYSAPTARKAEAAGLDVLLHLPMQAEGTSNGLGRGALFTDMGSGEITETLGHDLDEVPGAIGVNNHMGSAFTKDRAGMTIVLNELKARGLFFLDSRTTAETVAESTAREMGVPTSARKVFLDDSNDIEDVRFQFTRLVRLARKDGEAIAIGHPRPATLEVLGEELPKLDGEGVTLVRVSTLVR